MSVYKINKTGRWAAQVSEDGRKVHLGTFATQREAKAALREREASRPSNATTIDQWRARWIQTPTWKPGTRAHNTERTAGFCAAHGHRRMADLTRVQARAWVTQHPATHGSLSAMFGAAVYEDILIANPFYKLVRRTTKKRDLQPDWLTETDVTALEHAAFRAHGPLFGGTVAGMIRFAVETGVRPGELFVIQHSDLDVDAGALYVRRSAESKTRTVGLPKSNVAREVVLSTRAADAAAQAMRWPGTDRVFSTIRGHQFWHNTFTWTWKPVKAVADRNAMQFYELRHLCATRLLEAGMTEADVAIQLGHTDMGELVRRTYGHPETRSARDRIRATMNGAA